MKTQAQQRLAELERKVAAGQLTRQTADIIAARVRDEQANTMWRTALDAHTLIR